LHTRRLARGQHQQTTMIAEGTPAPDFTLESQFGTKFHLADHKGKHNVLLLFYPLDWTPT
jgi:peroxiredoxin